MTKGKNFFIFFILLPLSYFGLTVNLYTLIIVLIISLAQRCERFHRSAE